MTKLGGIETVKSRMARRNQVAECIVDDIMTNGGNQRGERLMIVLPGGKDGGGWSRESLVARIANMLTKLGID